MSDTIKKCDELGYFNDEWNEPMKIPNNTLTKLEALDILNRIYLHCGKDEFQEEFDTLRKYLKAKL